MPVPPPKFIAGVEPTYTRSVFEAILAGMGQHDDCKSQYVLSEDGARVREIETAGSLAWHPWCEVMAPGSPNPLDEPWLRFPFTARQLAALMVDGWGYFIQDKYGDWQDGPDEEELLSIGQLGGKAKEALRAAYAAYRHAAAMAPRLDQSLAVKASELRRQYDVTREAAMGREQLREPGLPDAEYTARLARVNAAVADLKQPMKEARQAADLAYASWRRAVVQHLLLPIEEVAVECFECLMLRALPPDRRAEALHQTQALQAFQDSAEGRAHWELICEQQRVEAELRRWQLLQPQSVTETLLHDTKLKELAAELTAISDRMRALEETPPTTPLPMAASLEASAIPPPDYSRLATRDELVAAFGSFGLKRNWFNDLNSRQWLLKARKVLGHGQRGRRREPLFCPLEVMTGLLGKSRKSRLSTDAGWRILEHRFPATYAANSVGDPREPPG